MPARVVRVLFKGKSAIVRHLGSGQTQEVHIDYCRFLSAPENKEMKWEWNRHAESYAKRSYECDQDVQLYLQKFWEDLEEPQLKVTLSDTSNAFPTPKKRARYT